MFNNKYSHVNSLTLLKARRPRRKVVPEGPDLSHFLTSSPDLKRLANFGLEMMKFLPRFEQLLYEGNYGAKEGEEGTVTFEHGGNTTTATQEWWDAFREYGVDQSEIPALFGEIDLDGGGYGSSDAAIIATLTDIDGDGKITNADTIPWVENNHLYKDGFTKWRGQPLWISGQHHRTGDFGRSKGIAGQDSGASFKNLDFIAEASEWNHIGLKHNRDIKESSADFVGDQAYFINDFLSATGHSWSEVQNLLASQFPGQSYYQIIMERSYSGLSEDQATLLVAAMYESRERAWSMMSEVFGPANLTRDDQAMMPYIRNFVEKNNPYSNHHAISFFPFFLKIQHSFQNRLTTFYEENKGHGFDRSALDRKRFWEFAQWIGRPTFDGVYNGDKSNTDVNDGTVPSPGKLYDYRKSFYDSEAESQSSAYQAVDNLINGWFGATKVENEKPVWDGYQSVAEKKSDADPAVSGNWVNIPSTAVQSYYGGDWHNYSTTQAFVPSVSHPAYAWDKKWRSALFVKEGSETRQVNTRSAGWADVMYHLWQQGAITSRLNPAIQNVPHPQYAVAQFSGLSYNSMMAGPEFASNWVVYASGMLMKWGQGLDLAMVMEKMAAGRVAQAEFKQDMTDFARRKEELEDEEAQEQKIAAKRLAKARNEQKKMLMRLGKRNRAPRSSRSNAGRSSGYARGTREYAGAMQRLRLRLLKASGKHKAWLKKLKENTK